MPILFNSLLREAIISLADVRLLRHKDQRAQRGRGPYELYRDNRPEFESYQSTQDVKNRARLAAPLWASFVGTPRGETLFAGIYRARYIGLLRSDKKKPHVDGFDLAGSCDEYELALDERFTEFDGRLVIDWGDGKRSWIQRADQQEKKIIELRTEFREPDFPGYLHLVGSLSEIARAPRSWIVALIACRGVYLLTCPKTREQYVGSAAGEGGFWQRWKDYMENGHGNNLGLQSRDPSDYQVSILEVAGSSATCEDILQAESLWKRKLQSREMGLNRN
ncbi:MAG: GIY-YIG nuclease family protein [Planctomycetaceae bacterium]